MMVLIRKIHNIKRKARLQESLRKVQNIDSFYEFMKNNVGIRDESSSCCQSKYENVSGVSQTSEVPSDDCIHSHQSCSSDGEDVNVYSSLDPIQFDSSSAIDNNAKITKNIDYLQNNFESATKPIDEALLLLKLSTDQL